MTKTGQYCTFHLGELFFGIDVERVQEVIRAPDITPVPLSPVSVEGLINLRGQVITALDLRRRLGFPPLDDKSKRMNIVVRAEDRIGVLVDRIDDVLDVDQESVAPPPETVDGKAKEVISGVFQLADRLLLIIDIERVLDPERLQEQVL